MDSSFNNKKKFSRIAIGTAQFGLDYGISNTHGRISATEIDKILSQALTLGIDTLDTAKLYGKSEEAIGLSESDAFKVITKIPAIPENTGDVTLWIHEQLKNSLHLLKRKNIHGLLLHRPEQLTSVNGKQICSALLELKQAGVIQKIGVSIYSPEEIPKILEHITPDIIQLPFNILDQRFAQSGDMTKLHHMGIEVHVRSLFLQGLLLMPLKRLPLYFKPWHSFFYEWHYWLQEKNITPLEACISFAASFPEISKFIIGLESSNQLCEIASAFNKQPFVTPDNFSSSDINLINPALWNIK